MGMIRLTVRLLLFVLFLGFTALVAVAVSLTEWCLRRPLDRTPYARFCFAGAGRCLGFRLRHRGEPAEAPALFVSNHISWSDIPVLGGLAPLRFLSKAEVGRWPVIGWLAHQAGTLFIQRGRGKAGQSREEIARTLNAGQSVLVFPEGTTTAGLTVLPFHGRLLKAAVESGRPLQPISIGYLRNGLPDHLAPFIGDDDFHTHLLRMLRQPAVEVAVIYHPPVTVSQDSDIETVAAQLQQTVADGLHQIHQAGGLQASGQAGAAGSAMMP
ncbi:1-acyl-sn-glycerol-3-phosphate acyltransferase [Marinobacter sp. CA1]|nr:1-acyl-sn-glycerol-3-phosphate acyltransferase [Marinobacter sp. CA1]